MEFFFFAFAFYHAFLLFFMIVRRFIYRRGAEQPGLGSYSLVSFVYYYYFAFSVVRFGGDSYCNFYS